MHIEPMVLRVNQESSPFVLRDDTTATFVLSGGNTMDITLQLGIPLTGVIDLRGPQGEPALRALSGFVGGMPQDGEVVLAGNSPYAFTMTEADCVAEALVAATAETIFLIKNEGVTIGTITFAAGAFVGVIDITTPEVDKNDLISIHAPVAQDATLANITLLLA